MITALYAGFAALFLLYLSIRVIRLRRTRKVSIGHQGDAEIERAMRVQSNFVEYTPIALILLYLIEAGVAPGLVVHALGAGFLVARVLHFNGFRSPEAPAFGRVYGMMGTFLFLAAMAAIAIAQAVMQMIG